MFTLELQTFNIEALNVHIKMFEICTFNQTAEFSFQVQVRAFFCFPNDTGFGKE